MKSVALFIGCALASVIAAALLLWMAMPLGQVLSGLAGSWKWIGDRELSQLGYFRSLMGTLDLSASLARMAAWTAGFLLIFGIVAAAGWFTRDARRARPIGWVLAALALLGIWLFGPGTSEARLNPFDYVPIPLRQAWAGFTSPLPLLMTLIGIVLLARLIRGGEKRDLPRLALKLMLTIFGGAMLARMLFNTTVLHYGFALAMPATVVAVALLVGWLPAWMERRGRGGWLLRAVTLALLLFIIVLHVRITMSNVAAKVIAVSTGNDLFLADGRGAVVNAMLLDLRSIARPGQTLLCAPEGLILNYLARMKSPTGHLNFTPPALIMYGERRMLRDLQASPPDYVMLVHIDSVEYGARFFGKDYGREIAQWIRQEYQPVQLYGQEPFIEGHFGMMLLRRNR